MDLIPISANQMINIDLIESIDIRIIEGQKVFAITIGGKSYIPEVGSMDLLALLVKKGTIKSTNQFFSI